MIENRTITISAEQIDDSGTNRGSIIQVDEQSKADTFQKKSMAALGQKFASMAKLEKPEQQDVENLGTYYQIGFENTLAIFRPRSSLSKNQNKEEAAKERKNEEDPKNKS